MQFLVYLTVLMVAISTVLLEVHWLTSPAPQPKPAIQASAPPPPKTEGPNRALSPIYPKTSRPAEPGNSQAPNASPNTVQTTSPTAPSPSQEQSAAATMVAQVNTRQAPADPANASNRNDNQPQTAQSPSSNRCDVQACAGTYRSFRASDCTYQPFDGRVRRLCEKSPGQRVAREREQPERRRWGGDAQARDLDRPVSGRRSVDEEDDDVAADFDDARREPLGFFLFGRRPRW
jgi:BA14K-like protein